MAGQEVYCHNCKKCSTSKAKGSGWITLVLILFYIIPAVIYSIWRNSGFGVCGICGSENIIDRKLKPTPKINQQPINQCLPPPLPQENVNQVNCPDCRELIRFDARKCKHCGSYIKEKLL